MRISALAVPTGDSKYYSKEWLQLIEDHLTYLRNHEETTSTPMEEYLRYRKDRNFYGMLNEMGLEPKYFSIYLRVNQLKTPDDFDETFTTLIVPSKATMDKLMQSLTIKTK